MRDRLVELLMESEMFNGADGKADVKCLADHLLANGVIVPKENEELFHIIEDGRHKYIEEVYLDEIKVYELRDLQKHGYYFTKEEAEQALKGGEKE